jgi:metallo-beta-lactamase family protein
MGGGGMGMRITFLGAAGTVTGSRFLVEADGTRVLVDCGLFQGLKSLRLKNRDPLGVDPASLDAVLLTHAHLDHSGWLPVLVRDGFAGPIYCTPPTADLAEILLADSGRLQEEDARYANKKGYSRHKPAEPLYTEAQAAAVTPRFQACELDDTFSVGSLRVRYQRAGHILGAASILIEASGRSVFFSGDLGRPHDLVMWPPDPPPAADMIVMESTYGDREHKDTDVLAALADAVGDTVRDGGVAMIPAFAVGRSQLILYVLWRLRQDGRLPSVPTFLNSPMAIEVSEVFRRFDEYHRLTELETNAALSSATFTRKVEESKELNRRRGPMVLVAGAGMLTGGRILHHLKAFGADPMNAVLLVGYQAPGTRGAALIAGDPQLKIHGRYWPMRAQVHRLDALSGHADRSELLDWLGAAAVPPEKVMLVHGEPQSADALRRGIADRHGLDAEPASMGQVVRLD